MAIIRGLQPFEKGSGSTYILLISPETIPHLVLVKGNEYFSLTHKKVVIGESFDAYFSFLTRAKRKLVFLELDELKNDPYLTFSFYKRADRDKATCLNPIIDTVFPESKAHFIFELVPELYGLGKVKGAFQVNLEGDLTNLGDFNLSVYSKEAIFSYIESLNKKYAKRP